MVLSVLSLQSQNKLQTDSILDNLISRLQESKSGEWREANPDLASKGNEYFVFLHLVISSANPPQKDKFFS